MSIVGDLRLADEYMHAPTNESSFNESMMFNFFDATLGAGGFVRIGNRVNEGHAEVTVCVFLPDGGVLLEWAKPAIEVNDRFDAAGLSFQVVQPALRLRVRYHGEGFHLSDPMSMREPRTAFLSHPRVPTELNLDINGLGPIVGSATGNTSAVIFLAGVGHYQQALRAFGELRIGDRYDTLDALGARDHSWGRRVWSKLLLDRSFWVTFGPDLAFICCKTLLQGDDVADVMGCVIEGSNVTRLRHLGIESHYRINTHYHDRCRLQIEDVTGRRFHLSGEVRSYVPLRHRTPGQETVFLGQAMTEFKLGKRSALGLSEYFDAEAACPALADASRRDAYIAE